MSAQHEGEPASLLEVRGLTKIFGTLRACDNVDLTIGRGEIHALLGENGADGHLVGRATGPPVLGPEPPEQAHVELEQPGLDRITGRSGNRPTPQAEARG